MLLQIPGLFTPDEAREARTMLESAPWEDGRATAGHRAASVKSNLQLPADHPVAKTLGERILDRLAHTPLFIAAALPLRILPPRFNRYEGGGTYGNHVDNAIFPIPGTALRVRTDISTTIFFSDPEDYDGGELIVEDTFGEKPVKLPAGDAIVYPGSSLHRVMPVTRGTRFASFFWTQSLVRDDQRRRMLFELDCSIQKLGSDHPGHGSIDGFTNVYHNLLRQWSET
ncbi:Fe2+-dependent dioxygenase [Sphingobium lignivorans]|uniref:PKHD-type hydroxylase n=1 Tax=Sphingobium lignivorans TaxID=2735886 RepID=A0ABR6NJN2_9SPHN|nr:Fe2+-dependent dioxygenase [Sphingobium lignivorans]MBB5987497.1 PKHD-type hydroxylase [Sphingobium lignivorans]